MTSTGASSLTTGISREATGSYLAAWITAAVFPFGAALSLLLLPRKHKAYDNPMSELVSVCVLAKTRELTGNSRASAHY